MSDCNFSRNALGQWFCKLCGRVSKAKGSIAPRRTCTVTIFPQEPCPFVPIVTRLNLEGIVKLQKCKKAKCKKLLILKSVAFCSKVGIGSKRCTWLQKWSKFLNEDTICQAWQAGYIEMESMIDIEIIKKLTEKLNGRTIDEALKYYELCKTCSKFRMTFCNRDRGCDKEELFIARLARGYCKNQWDNFPKNASAYRYFETADLIRDSYKLISLVPPDVDAIAGAARSGLFPATVLSTALHRPLLSIGKADVVAISGGWRIGDNDSPNYKKIFLVEDTVYSGRAISISIELLKKAFPEAQILSGAVYVHPKSLHKVDCHVLIVPGRHYLEWNFFNSIAISRCVFDFDGILCEEISSKDDDDGERYIQALKNAIPKHYVRREPIPIIVTARLEKYREITLEWLAKHQMSCKKLIMGPWKNNQERAAPGEISRFKAGVYSSYSYTMFVESDPRQAAEIADITGKEVLCPSFKRVFLK